MHKYNLRKFRLALALLILTASLDAAPLAPNQLRISDTPEYLGETNNNLTGFSSHVFFRARHRADAGLQPATKLRVQLSTDETMGVILWDSGFVAIAPTADNTITPAIAYTGPALAYGATYYWHAATQDDTGVSSPYSQDRNFTLAAGGAPADLRATTGIASESIQGNPVAVVNWPPSFTAEHTGEGTVAYGQVQTAKNLTFTQSVWLSSVTPIGVISAGQRSMPIYFGGSTPPIGEARFWRIRFGDTPEITSPWSTARSSVVRPGGVIGSTAPAGFAREARTFGSQDFHASDVLLADVNLNGVVDAVLTTSAEGMSHAMYPDLGTATPGQPVPFGSSAGGRTLVAPLPSLLILTPQIATVDQSALTVYSYTAGEFTATELVTFGDVGEPVEMQVCDTNWDGYTDIVVAFGLQVMEFLGSEHGLLEPTTIAEFLEPVTSLLVTDLSYKDGLIEYWVISGGTLYLYRDSRSEAQVWPLDDATHLALADAAVPTAPEFVLAGPTSVGRCTVTLFDSATLNFHSQTLHGFDAPCQGVYGAKLDDGTDSDAVVLLEGAVLAMLKVPGAFALHEYIGHPGGAPIAALAVADTNLDSHLDVVLGYCDSPAALHFNRPRLTVSIANTEASQVLFGEAYAEFTVSLSAPPVSMVEVWCETYEDIIIDEGGGIEGDGDGLPDPADWLSGQLGPMPYVPTLTRMVFAPGQMLKKFSVPLTSYYAGASWTLHARIVSAVGALVSTPIATAPIYGIPQQGMGPPATPGMQRDWNIHGEVRAIVEANGNTYVGGDFDGVSWDANGLAAITRAGERRLALPGVTNGQVRCMIADPTDGSIYFGGSFTIDAGGGVQVKNLAKCTAAGALVPSFAPNPTGTVNSIDLDGYGRVYFGGKFTALEKHSGQAYRNIGWVYTDGGHKSGTDGSAQFGVDSSASENLDEVLVLKHSQSGGIGYYLLVGGKHFNLAYGSAASSAASIPVSSFVGFQVADPSGSPLTSGAILATVEVLGGHVNAIEVDTFRTMGGSAPYSHPIFIGGDFSHVRTAVGTSFIDTSAHMAVVNFTGWTSTDHGIIGYNSPVYAIAIDSDHRIWVGRQRVLAPVVDPLARYTWGTQAPWIVHASSFSSGINATVTGLAAGSNELLASGAFSTAGGANVSGMAVFSTSIGSLGSLVPLNATLLNGSVYKVAASYNGAGHNGWLVCGAFTEILAERGNLAAMNSQGQLLPWNPLANGPVNALAYDPGSPGTILIGGNFNNIGGYTRERLAAVLADTASTQPTGWNPQVLGIGVNAMVLDGGGYVYIGGDFVQVGTTARIDVAKINVSSGGVHSPWYPELTSGTGDAVYAMLLDGGRLFIGGSFLGVAGGIYQPDLLAVNLTNGGLDNTWLPVLSWPSAVGGIAATSNEIVFVGDFTTVNGASRNGAAAVLKADATLTAFQPTAFGGELKTVAATSGGLVYLGGDFTSVAESATGTAQTRKGAAAFDISGTLTSWEANVLGAGTGEVVNTIRLETVGTVNRTWLGGEFTGTPLPSQNDLVWYSGGWFITTASLPAANAGQAYNVPTLSLSGLPNATWSMLAPGAPNLIMSPLGVISGFAPARQPGQWLPVPVLVTADAGPGISTSRLYMLTVTPPPPPTLVRITGPSNFHEGDDPVLSPAQEWTIELTQPFSVPVHVRVDYSNGTAHNGYDYAPVYTDVIFYPAGSPNPPYQGAHTLVAFGLTADLPVTTFGNTTLDPARSFTISLTSLTPNVGADPMAYYVNVTIDDDDLAVPTPAYVRNLQVRENPTTPANPLGVVSDQPWLDWDFGTDVPGETQGAWQVQLAHDAAFANIVFDSGPLLGSATLAQLPLILDGLDCYARVRLWPTGGGAVSNWAAIQFHRNHTPPQAANLVPGALPPTPQPVTGGRPMLTWDIQNDADGDAQHFIVHLNQVSGPIVHVIDSRFTPYWFEQDDGTNWATVSQSGVPAGHSQVRVRVPASMTLDLGQWDWHVDSADPYELAPGAEIKRIDVQQGCEIRGVYKDTNGATLTGRDIWLVRLPNHTPVFSAPALWNGNDFMFNVSQPLAPGEIIAICVDPALPFSEYACSILRYPGGDLIEDDGPLAKVELVKDKCLLDSRGQEGFHLGDLTPVAGATPFAGFALQDLPTGLTLANQFTSLETRTQVRVRGDFAAPDEPTCLAFSAPQVFTVAANGALSVEEGAEASLYELGNSGSLVVLSGATLILGHDSTTTGDFTLLEGSTLELDGGDLSLNGGVSNFEAAVVSATNLTESVKAVGGALSADGTLFDGCTLEIAQTAPSPAITGATFTANAGTPCIWWRRAAAQPMSLSGLRFQGLAGVNVLADSGADALTMVGCGGDLAGESYDSDPGEQGSGDIVTWETAEISGLAAHAGDERILLVWQARAQTGGAFTFEIHESSVETGPFTAIDTTSDSYYVHDALTNAATHYYFVRTLAWGQQSDSEIVSSAARDALIEHASPQVVSPDGLFPAVVIGDGTHFSTSTTATTGYTGVTISAASIVVLGPGLLLFDIETASAQEGTADIDIETPDVWSELGAPGYSEALVMQAEVQPPPSFNYPRAYFVATGGAVEPDDQTSGAFLIAAEFDDDGGAPIDPSTFEAVVNRDIEVNSQTVEAGTNLADPALGLWGTPTASGASWTVDQSGTVIEAGELIISIRVANEYGFQCGWRNQRIFVEGAASDLAFISGDLVQGETGQQVVITCNDIQNADSVWFPDDPTEIQVTQVQLNQTEQTLTVTVDVGQNAQIGSHRFEVGPQGGSATSWGTYRTIWYPYGDGAGVGGLMPMSVGSPYPGPRATVGAQNVVLQNGEFRWSSTDIGLKGRSLSVAWDRNYRSSRATDCGPLGNGWFGTCFQYLLVNNAEDEGIKSFRWTTPLGEEYTFESNGPFIPQQGTFTTPDGIAVEAHVTNGLYLNTVDPIQGSVIIVFPKEIEIRTPDRTVYVFQLAYGDPDNAAGAVVFRLRTIEDANRNRVALHYHPTGELKFVCSDNWNETPQKGQYLSFSYDPSDPTDLSSPGDGRIRWISRVAKDSSPETLEVVGYRYSQTKQLTLHRLAADPRHGEVWQGLAYDQAVDSQNQPIGPDLLCEIFRPSMTVPDEEPDNSGFWVNEDSAAQIPDLTVAYREFTVPQGPEYRVETQTFGPATGAVRKWAIGYNDNTPISRTVTSPEGVVTEYVLNDEGQAISIDVGGATTTYTYDALQALISETRPLGGTTSIAYARDEVVSGGFDIFLNSTLSQVVTNVLPPGGDWALHVGRTVRLSGPDSATTNAPDWCQYFIVWAGSTGPTLFVLGDLVDLGCPDVGVFTLYDNTNDSMPLARFQSVQTTVSTQGGEPRVYSTTIKAIPVSGRPFPTVTANYGPHGAASFIKEDSSSTAGASRTITVRSRYTEADGETANSATRYTCSTQTLDAYGRLYMVHATDGARSRTISHEYYDAGTDDAAYQGYLKSTAVSGTSAASATTTYEYDGFGHLRAVKAPVHSPVFTNPDYYKSISYTNPRGQVWYMRSPTPATYDSAGTVGVTEPTETWLYYDIDGRLQRTIVSWRSSEWSGSVTLADENDTRKSLPESDPSGPDVEDSFLRPGALNDQGWVHTLYVYNEFGELIEERQDLDIGQTAISKQEFDKDGRLSKEIDAEDRATRYEYDNRNHVVGFAQVNAADDVLSASTFEYDDNGNLTKETDPVGNSTEHEYDGFDRLTQSSAPGPGGSLINALTYASPSKAEEVKSTLGLSATDFRRATWTEYDQLGRERRWHTLARDKAGAALDGSMAHDGLPCAVSWSELNGAGQPMRSLTRATGGGASVLETFVYDGLGRPKTHSGSLGETSSFDYDLAGNLTRSESEFAFWNGDQIDDSTSLNSNTHFDPAGRELALVDELGKLSKLTRHSLGWVERAADPAEDPSTNPFGRYTKTQYNFVGWPRFSKVGEGNEFTQTETKYDLTGLVIEETAWQNGTQDPQSTSYQYDELGRIKVLSRPDTGNWHYSYDAAGRLTSETQPEGVVLQHTYDAASNLTELKVMVPAAGASPVSPAETQNYEYNEYGDVLNATTKDAAGNPTSRLEMEYNSLGLIESQKLIVYKPGGSDPIRVEVLSPHPFSENHLGFESRYTTTRSDNNWSATAEYDARGRHTQTGLWDGRSWKTTFQQEMPVVVQEYGIGESTDGNPTGPRLVTNTHFPDGILLARKYGWNQNARHVVASHPNNAGTAVEAFVGTGTGVTAGSSTRFNPDKRGGLNSVDHYAEAESNQFTGFQVMRKRFAGVDVRFDYSGNPVLEQRAHQGGLSRVMEYDYAGRLKNGLHGHLPAAIPGDDLPNDAPGYLDPVTLNVDHQWRRGFVQDSVDNINQFGDVLRDGGSDVSTSTINQDLLMDAGSPDERNLIGQRSDATGQFAYDKLGRLKTDPTTQLSYEHNYRGQVVAIMSGSEVLRGMIYDCFGRMVHQVDAPGSPEERGTIFVPNVGLGGDGGGADTAAEVSYTRDATDYVCTEVVQFTYGLGAIGGGIGWKRLVEFVAYCRENAPYYRMLHEDTMGSTIATTSLWGDRLDEYDYTDYGVPLHAPVALDGRWITSIQPHASYGGVSVVTLLYDMLDPEKPFPQLITLGKSNELVGCEVRVVNPAGGAGNMFACSTVISHLGKTLHIQDTGGAVAAAWTAGSPETRALAAVYDLREGFNKGVIDSVSTGTWAFGSWPNEPCTYLRVDHGPFEPWMQTLKSQEVSNPLWVTLTSGANPPLEVLVLGVDDPVDPQTSSANFELVVRGNTLPAWVTTGAWYFIDGTRDKMQAAQSGKWRVNATSAGNVTTFTLDEYAAISEEMQGWMLQPDVNQQVYAPIIGVNELTGTVTVSGNLAGPTQGAPWLGSQGEHFRIFAPPGAEISGPHPGTLSQWVSASSSRCLYNGYRYESPLAGFVHTTATGQYIVQHRQSGRNFAGQHYTLHRHYDPNLMRFTSPDPAASPFSNLGSYAGNNPAGSYDPDGLEQMFPYQNDWENRPTEAAINTVLDIFGNMLTKTYGGGTAATASTIQVAQGENVADTYVGQGVQQIGQRYDARVANSGGGAWAHLNAINGLGNDVTGFTGLSESITGRDSITGEVLSDAERHNRFVDGTSSLLLTTAAIAGPKVVSWGSRVGGKPRVGGMPTVGGPTTVPAPRMLRGTMKPGHLQSLKAMQRSGAMDLGRAVEAQQLGISGSVKNTQVLRPGPRHARSKLFKAIVGRAQYTPKNAVMGTIPESIHLGHILEIKHGRSTLYATYQIRLQTYYAVRSGRTHILRTNRPVANSLRNFMGKWGGIIEPLK